MKKEDRINLYKSAEDKFGRTSQVVIAIEEMAELTVALTQSFFRERHEKAKVIEEIADVLIVCEQLALMYGERDVQAVIDKKLERLSHRVKIGKQNGEKKEDSRDLG
jgi:NTP pyrophosphatase (non-canonical NTP hydrolase)